MPTFGARQRLGLSPEAHAVGSTRISTRGKEASPRGECPLLQMSDLASGSMLRSGSAAEPAAKLFIERQPRCVGPPGMDAALLFIPPESG